MAYEPGRPTQADFDDHSARHEDAGADIVVPAVHATRHQAAGADALLTIFNDNGTLRNLRPFRGTVVGPASYAAGGIPVDLSATFSSIAAVICLRAFTTATGATLATRSVSSPNETGTDLYSAAKFRILVHQTGNHTHTYDKTDTPTGGENSGSAGADPHTHALTFTSTASGNGGIAGLGELGITTNLSALTYEFVVWGVPV